ncbi:MAG TPA: polyphenol oxidase family protein [Acidimicrobiales bacterium]|nr:polyphenol oxidase family protein [Acidimicrobiales bacterium]
MLDLGWCRPHQVHGADCLAVTGPGTPGTADAVVTATAGLGLAVLTADCASVALASPEGIAGAVHAGWRGLVAGVVPAAVAAMAALGATTVVAALGPCIRPECYEFGPDDLAAVAGAVGADVSGRTSAGGLALDLPAAVRASLAAAGAELVADAGVCTACEPGHFSHRRRGDQEREALVVWRPGGRP